MKKENSNEQSTASSLYEQAIAAVQAAEREATGLISLNPDAKRSVVRVRRGAEKIISQMILAAQAFPHYAPAGINPQAMLEDLATLEHIRQLRMVITAFLGSAEDTDLKATGDLWIQALDIYAALSRKTSGDGQVEEYLAGMKSFLSRPPKPDRENEAVRAAENAPGTAAAATKSP